MPRIERPFPENQRLKTCGILAETMEYCEAFSKACEGCYDKGGGTLSCQKDLVYRPIVFCIEHRNALEKGGLISLFSR